MNGSPFNKVAIARKFLKEQGVDYLLVNSTNEFLAEYAPLEENSRYALTGFSGSTGDALLSQTELFLFVDGRYHIQADNEVDHSLVTVVKLQSGQNFLDELVKKIKPDATLGVFSKKNTQARVESLRKKVNVKLLDFDLIVPEVKKAEVEAVKIGIDLTGLSTEEKIKNLNIDGALVLTNPEEVSYILNERDFSKNYSCTVNNKIIIETGTEPFNPSTLNHSTVYYADKSSISARDWSLLENAQAIESPVKKMKAVKTDAEIEHYKSAFARTDETMRAIRDYIYNNDNISEYDITQRLEQEFKNHGAKNLSFKSIVAKDKNSALAHYSKNSPDEIITDGSLVLIDCGAFYEGGLATDITRVFVKGEPTKLQRQVYTTVLKTLLGAFQAVERLNGLNVKLIADDPNQASDPSISQPLNHPTSQPNGFAIDAVAREIIAQNPIEGFVFNHGLGHGLGINVHEYPPSLSASDLAKVEIKDNMCFTIEPGLYNEKHFGIRLENACYFKCGKIHSLTGMDFEQKLINYDMLNEKEREWLFQV